MNNFMVDPKHHESAEPNRLADFIRQKMPLIVDEWSVFAQTRTPASNNMTAFALKDHIEEILLFIADDLETSQTSAQQTIKSKGNQPKTEDAKPTAAQIHADLRLSNGFDMDQMVSEYRALRASVIKLWSNGRNGVNPDDWNDLIRFNEAVDQSISESISRFTEVLDRSRNLLMGVLGHDLRNPIGAASMCAEAMITRGELNSKQHRLIVQVRNGTLRASRIIEDILDLTHIQIGSQLPVSRQEMNVETLCEQVIDEVRTLHPDRTVDVHVHGSMDVEWDSSRMGQVLSNLVSNAIAHGSAHTPVNVFLEGHLDRVVLTVQNQGNTIPPDAVQGLFDLFKRGAKGVAERSTTLHLGVGLYITKQIIQAHGGTLEVKSSDENGTNFIATLSRKATTVGAHPNGSFGQVNSRK
jgi:signal transduction histidine kinase